jgi:hypothetical protein
MLQRMLQAPRLRQRRPAPIAWLPLAAALGLGMPACAGPEPVMRALGGPLELSAPARALPLDPPLQPRQRVQYVELGVPDAPRWRSGGAPGMAIDPAGRVYRIEVVLERADGQRVVLDDLSFGRGLMFSHLPARRAPGGSDLPHGDRFVRLWLAATPPLSVGAIRWLDITNP